MRDRRAVSRAARLALAPRSCYNERSSSAAGAELNNNKEAYEMSKPKTNVIQTNQAPMGEHAAYLHDKERQIHIWVDKIGLNVYVPRWRYEDQLESADYQTVTPTVYKSAIGGIKAVYIKEFGQY